MSHKFSFKNLGPGLLFAGAAIGVSHLVQSTRAGADYGFGFIWAIVLIHIVKYPFFQFGGRFANATGKSLLWGYFQMHPWFLKAYFIINLASMFTIQAAVTLVTTGLALNLTGITLNPLIMAIILTVITMILLIVGKYQLLDNIMKVIIVTLTISTIIALVVAGFHNEHPINFHQKINFNNVELGFLIAFLGWMPAPLDVSIWQSLWGNAKAVDQQSKTDLRTILFDFNVGYLTTLALGIVFIGMGAFVMYSSGEIFSDSALGFSNQLIGMYTKNLGNFAGIFIGIAAFTTMFSTTITTLDASPRAMEETINLLTNKKFKYQYLGWMVLLSLGTLIIISYFTKEMLTLVKIATILSFITAPFFAYLNYKLIFSKHTPKTHQPGLYTKYLSWFGILFLVGFSIWYATTLF